MTNPSPKIVFFGNERLATGVTTSCPTLTALLAAGYDVAAVVLHNQTATSRSKRALEIAELAKLHNIPVLLPHKLTDCADQLKSLQADIGVLVAFGKIVPQSIIDLFPRGIVNVHPSALPLRRGPTPLESTILSGQTETAVSLMQLSAKMDAGPVYAQRALLVPSNTTKQSLANSASQIGSNLVVQHLPAIIDGSLQPTPQDDALATYDQLITKADGQVDWHKPAVQLERQIRAYSGWPKSTATVGAQQFIITQAVVVPTTGKPGSFEQTKKELLVYCGKDAIAITHVQPLNKKEMPIQAFLSGYSL
ncbi:MAG: methionyl-tRNA formyltransferase [Candidatus Saccharimonadales bacterium]